MKQLLKRFLKRVIYRLFPEMRAAELLAGKLSGWQITGMDYDRRAVKMATQTYQLNNLEFAQGDMVTWLAERNGHQEELGRFRAIVSFDTIEHVEHQEIALMRIADNLADDGVFLISTPISFPATNFNPEWHEHTIEYGASDLINLLRRFFGEVLVPEEGTLPAMDFWTDFINKDKEKYKTVANPIVCKKPVRIPEPHLIDN